MLSPSAAGLAGTGGRLGKLSVHPASPASSVYSTNVLSFPSAMVFIFHFPLTSASEIAAGAAGAGAMVAESVAGSAAWSMAELSLVLPQASRTTAQQQVPMRRITASIRWGTAGGSGSDVGENLPADGGAGNHRGCPSIGRGGNAARVVAGRPIGELLRRFRTHGDRGRHPKHTPVGSGRPRVGVRLVGR